MLNRQAILFCLAILLAFWLVQCAARGEQDLNISIESNDSTEISNYSLRSKQFEPENLKLGTIRSEVNKAMTVDKQNHSYKLSRRLLPGCQYCSGDLDINSICTIFDYLRRGDDSIQGWKIAPDPITNESIQSADLSIDCGGTKNVATGDCDDYAVAVSTLINHVGGSTMIILAEMKSEGKHMFPMVFLGRENDKDNVEKIKNWLNFRYKTENTIIVRLPSQPRMRNRDTPTFWLSLDWFADYPGGSTPSKNQQVIWETNGLWVPIELFHKDPNVIIDYNRSLLAAEEPIWFDATKSTDDDGGISQFEWNFGDNSTNGSIGNITHIYEKPGIYKLTLKLTDNIGDINITKINLSIGKPLPLEIALDPRFPKVKEVITFTATGIIGRGDYNWSFGDENFQKGINLTKCSHSYDKADRYLVNLTITDDKNRIKSNIREIVVNDPPHAKIEWTPHIPNAKEKISFTGKGSTDDEPLKTYIWHFGDGTNATGRDVSHIYEKGGSYLVSLRVIDKFNGINDTQENIEVNSPPSAHFSFYPSSPTIEDIVKFDASLSSDPPDGSIKAYEWDFGDRKKDSGQYPEHKYEREGNYPVKLTVTDDNDLKDISEPTVIRVQNKELRHPPIAHINFAPTKDITTEDDVIFDATWSSDVDGGALTFEWVFNDGTRSNKSSFSHRFNETGEYTVNLTVIDEDKLNSSVSRQFQVTKAKDPVAFFTTTPTDIFEAGKEIIFNANTSQGESLSYRWDFGDNSSGKVGAIVNHTYLPKGYQAVIYNVNLTVKDKRNKENSYLQELKVEPAKAEPLVPLFDFEPKKPVAGQVVCFNASSSRGSIKSYEWNFGDGLPLGTKAVECHTFPANESVEITYEVILTLIDINGDKNRKSMSIPVSPPPPPPLQPSFNFAPQDPVVGQQVIFKATHSQGAIANYLWDFGDGSDQKDGAIVSHAFTASLKETRIYDVTLTVSDKNGKMFNSTKKVTVIPPQFPMINSLWIETSNGMEMYHHCEIYDQVKMVANSYGGTATFTEQYPDGKGTYKDYPFAYGRNEITFGADRLGEHIMGYTINGQYSNIVIIYVVEKGTLEDFISPHQYSSSHQYSKQVNPINLGMSYRDQSATPVQSITSFPTHYPGQSSYLEEAHYPGQTSDYLEEWLSM